MNHVRLLCLLVASSAMSCRPPIPDNIFGCTIDSDCPDNFTCVASRCRSTANMVDGGRIDGGPRDAAPPPDGRTMDSGGSCGDNMIVAPEQCDPPDVTANCSIDCRTMACGDGVVVPGELCLSMGTHTGVASPVNFGATAIAAGDFDGDGSQDVALATYAAATNQSIIQILPNRPATRTFETIVDGSIPVQNVVSPRSMTAVDLDLNLPLRDELFVLRCGTAAPAGSSCLSEISRADTSGFFLRSQHSLASYPWALTIGELDADDFPEAIIAHPDTAASGAPLLTVVQNAGNFRTVHSTGSFRLTMGLQFGSFALGRLPGAAAPNVWVWEANFSTAPATIFLQRLTVASTFVAASDWQVTTSAMPDATSLQSILLYGQPLLPGGGEPLIISVASEQGALISRILFAETGNEAGSIDWRRSDFPTDAYLVDIDNDNDNDIVVFLRDRVLVTRYDMNSYGVMPEILVAPSALGLPSPDCDAATIASGAVADFDGDGAMDVALAMNQPSCGMRVVYSSP